MSLFRAKSESWSFRTCLDLRHIGYSHRSILITLHHTLTNPGQNFTGSDAPNKILITILIDYSSGNILRQAVGHIKNVVKCHTEVRHFPSVGQNLILHKVTTDYRNLCHTTRCKKTRADHPFSNRAQFIHRHRVGSQPDHQHLPQNR